MEAGVAELLRIVGINRKFLTDRRRELQHCSSYTLAALLREFDRQLRGCSSSADVLKFLQSRYITHSEQEFIYILEQIAVEPNTSVSYDKLGVFFGDDGASKQAIKLQHATQPLSEECEKGIISIFEQVISNYRRLQTQRLKLMALGGPYQLFQAVSSNGQLSSPEVLLLVRKHCVIDDELASHILKCLGSEGRLTYRLFCYYAVSPQRSSGISEFRPDDLITFKPNFNEVILEKNKRIASCIGHTMNSQQRILGDKKSIKFSPFVSPKMHCEDQQPLERNKVMSLKKEIEFDQTLISPSSHKDHKWLFSPSMTKLSEFESRIRELQTMTTGSLHNRERRIESVVPHARSPVISSVERGSKKGASFSSSQAAVIPTVDLSRALNKHSRNTLKLGLEKSRGLELRRDETFSLGVEESVQSKQTILMDSPKHDVLREKERQILKERNLRGQLEKQIERSKQEIDELKRLLAESREKPPTTEPQYQSTVYRYRSPHIEQKTPLPHRSAGKIRSYKSPAANTTAPLNVPALSKDDTSNSLLCSNKTSGRLQLEHQLHKRKLQRHLDNSRRLCR